MAMQIQEIFDAYNAATLQTMANAAGLLTGKKKPNKNQLVLLMHEEYFTPERVKRSYEKLSSREKQVLNRLLLRGGEASSKALKRELVRAKLVTEPPEQPKSQATYYNQSAGYTGSPDRPHSVIFEDVIARLTYHGLVFSKPVAIEGYNYKFQFDPGEQLIIPAAVRLQLPPPEPLPLDNAVWQPTRVEEGQAARFLRDLYLYWDFVRRNEVALLQNGLVGKRHLKLINQALLAPDPQLEEANAEEDTGKLRMLRRMLEALGLIQAGHGHLRVVNPGKTLIPPFWSKADDKQIADCVQVWLTVENAGEIDKSVKQYQPDYTAARRHLVTALQKLSADLWHEADELLSGLQEKSQNFLFPERSKVESQKGRSYYYYGYGYNSGSPTELIKKMDEGEENFVQNACAGFLFACGLIELGYASEKAKRWDALRLTPLGRAALARVQPDAAPKPATHLAESAVPPAPGGSDQGRIVVQPNFQILAIGPVSLAMLAQIDLFAERRKADIGVFEYHLSRESVYSAQQAGMKVSEIQAFLQTAIGTPLPQNVGRTLDEWGAHHQRIIFRTGVQLLQAADEALLQQLLAHEKVGAHLARPLAPAVALVKKAHNDKLLKGLLQTDLLPAVSGDQPASADHSVVMDKTGLITPVHAVPSLHLSGRLARFAAPQADGRWQITAASARQVGGSRKKVQELLEEMGKLQRGPLPSALVDRIKTWGAYYGEASSEVVTLIEFRDRQALEELSKRPDLQGILTPFRAGERAIAVVPRERLAEVTGILTALGVILKNGLAR